MFNRFDEMTISEELLIRKTRGFYNHYGKRILDLIIVFPLFILLLPLYILISLAIILETGFPIIYKGVRGGYHNKPFHIFKFRSMVKNADKTGGGTTALHDPRITKVGNYLRKTKLDEIPQLFNILNGTMSFIGPRPELLRYTNQYEGEEKLIFEVRPGITDYSSIEFINLDEIVGQGDADEMYEKYVLKKKNALRIKYVKEVSFRTDIKLFSTTVWRVIQKALSFVLLNKHR